jgi:membrane-associated phospholipid phosphatase
MLDAGGVRALVVVAVISGVVATATAAHADVEPPPPPAPAAQSAYEIKLDRDLAAIAISTTVVGGWLLDLGPAWCAPECPSSRLNALDRPFAGNYSPGWSTASTIVAAGLLATPPIVLFAIESRRDAAVDTVVIAETLTMTAGLAAVFEVGARRPRPFLYGTNAPLADREETNAALSFYSSHTSLSFAAAVGLGVTLGRLHVAPRWRHLAYGLGLGAATFVGVARVISGNHFPTDVMAGAATGTGFGVLIPALHERGVTVTPVANADGTPGMSVAAVGTF